MDRIVVDLRTGTSTILLCTPEEEAAILTVSATYAADNTQDKRAMRAIDGLDRLQFEILFNVMNDLRELRAFVNVLRPGSFTAAQASQVTQAQFRDALITRWKALNASSQA